MANFQIINFEPEHREAFYQMSKAWLSNLDLWEPVDEEMCSDPWKSIIEPGGQVFVAVSEEPQGDSREVLGVVGILKQGLNFEIVKLYVDERYRGMAIGESLCKKAIDYASRQQAKKLYLFSTRALVAAKKVYLRLGFQEKPFPQDCQYDVCNVYMEYPI